MNVRKRLAFIFCLAILITGCSQPTARTYYDTLDLDTPESAVRTFVEAFRKEDFPTVYLTLAPSTQSLVVRNLNLLAYDQLIRMEHWDVIKSDIPFFSKGPGHGEHFDDPGYVFDQFMIAAKKHSALLIDLSGTVTIRESKESEAIPETQATDVIVDVENISGPVIFRMIQAPSGRWRVFQVITPGGNTEMRPWAVPTTKN